MKIIQIAEVGASKGSEGWPNPAAIAALRAWIEGIPASEVAMRYWTAQEREGRNARGLITAVKRELAQWASGRARPDLSLRRRASWA